MSDAFDRIAASSPIDRAAALAVTGAGEHWDFKRSATSRVFLAPPELRPIPHNGRDLVGLKKGRLTVIGLAKKNGKSGSRWVVRCACGNYELRKSSAMVSAESESDRCDECSAVDRMYRKSSGHKVKS